MRDGWRARAAACAYEVGGGAAALVDAERASRAPWPDGEESSSSPDVDEANEADDEWIEGWYGDWCWDLAVA